MKEPQRPREQQAHQLMYYVGLSGEEREEQG